MSTIRTHHTISMGSHPEHRISAKKWGRVLASAFVLTAVVASVPSMVSAADGTLDSTFGTGGKVTTDIGGIDFARSAAIQSDGKIVVVGDNGSDFAVTRYNTDGSLDTNFSSDGKVTTDIAGYTDAAYSVAIQSDGKIVVSGVGKTTMAAGGDDFAVVRYNTDGSLDTNFSTDGKVTTSGGTGSSDNAYSVAIQSDGRIVVAGENGSDFVVMRYNTDGSLDTNFDTDGKLTTDIGTSTSDFGYSVAIQSNGKLVVAGKSSNDFAVVRYNTDGSLDTTGFGTGGKVTTDIGGTSSDTGWSVALDSDGKIVVAGKGGDDFAVVRYKTDGSLDTNFSTDGKVTTDIGSSTSDAGYSTAIDSYGKIVVVGYAGSDFALTRYNTDGSLDTTFDSDGKVTTDIGTSTTDNGFSVAIQSDGKIIAVGASPMGPTSNFAVVRYEGTPPAVAPTPTVAPTTVAPTPTVAPTTVAQTATTVAATTSTTTPAPKEKTVLALPTPNKALLTETLLTPSAPVTLTSSGFTPGELVQLIVASTPQILASGNANSKGSITLSGKIPAGLSLGNHSLALYAPVSGHGVRQPITVVEAAATLPATGSNSSMLALFGALFVTAGLVAVTRRRLAR